MRDLYHHANNNYFDFNEFDKGIIQAYNDFYDNKRIDYVKC